MDSQIKIWDLKVGHGCPRLQPRVGALVPVWCDEVLMAPGPGGVPRVRRRAVRVTQYCVCDTVLGSQAGCPPLLFLLVVLPEGGGHLRSGVV